MLQMIENNGKIKTDEFLNLVYLQSESCWARWAFLQQAVMGVTPVFMRKPKLRKQSFSFNIHTAFQLPVS